SKDFAKQFTERHAIPTAKYQTFTDAEQATADIESEGAPIVIKAAGLAEGKGVTVDITVTEALEATKAMVFEKTFQEAGQTTVIEELLAGREFSLIAFVHENNVFPMIAARDHKRAYNNDEGPNTGGMGSFAPVPDITPEIIDYTTREV